MTSSCELHQARAQLSRQGHALLGVVRGQQQARWETRAGCFHLVCLLRWARLTPELPVGLPASVRTAARLVHASSPCPHLLPPYSFHRCFPNRHLTLIALTQHLLPGERMWGRVIWWEEQYDMMRRTKYFPKRRWWEMRLAKKGLSWTGRTRLIWAEEQPAEHSWEVKLYEWHSQRFPLNLLAGKRKSQQQRTRLGWGSLYSSLNSVTRIHPSIGVRSHSSGVSTAAWALGQDAGPHRWIPRTHWAMGWLGGFKWELAGFWPGTKYTSINVSSSCSQKFAK